MLIVRVTQKLVVFFLKVYLNSNYEYSYWWVKKNLFDEKKARLSSYYVWMCVRSDVIFGVNSKNETLKYIFQNETNDFW